MTPSTCYETISEKLNILKRDIEQLKKKRDEHAFTALWVKSLLYKNSPLNFSFDTFNEIFTDGQGDGGVDAILKEPEPESGADNLILCQSKYTHDISVQDVKDAIGKMIDFQRSMEREENSAYNEEIKSK